MPSTLEFASKKRKRKTRKRLPRNCAKGYNCGNSCINKSLKCRRKFSNQASTYAGWLKMQAGKQKKEDSAVGGKKNKSVSATEKQLAQRRQELKAEVRGLKANIGFQERSVRSIELAAAFPGKENIYNVSYDSPRGLGGMLKAPMFESELYKKVPGSKEYLEKLEQYNADVVKFNSDRLGGKLIGEKPKRSQNFSEQTISKGSTVTWKWGKGKANGKVLAVYHRSVTRKLGGSSITRNGTKDNPAYLIGQNDGSKILKLQSELIS